VSPDTPAPADDFDLLGGEQLELTDLINTLLDKGVVLHGEVTLAVADVDLVKLNLGLLLAALATVETRPNANRTSLANAFGPPSFDLPSRQRGDPPQAQGLAGTGGAGVREASDGAPGAGEAPPALQATPIPGATPPEQTIELGLPTRINADASAPESSLARLVLTLIEVLRKVLEHQAVRRMDGGKLSPAEIERLGLALSKLNDRMDDLKRVFGLTNEELQIDQGPLGRLR